MIILIAGSSHTGKTRLSQQLLEKYHYPYFSIDHLKMGLIRSKTISLTPEDDKELTQVLWPIVKEIIKTAIENHQNLIIEGCYIPFSWKKDFDESYLSNIKYYCLIMSKKYIETHFDDIKLKANVIERRIEDDTYLTKELLIQENAENLKMCVKYQLYYILIDNNYPSQFDI